MESRFSLNIAIVTDRPAWDWTPAAPRFGASHFARVDLGTNRDKAIRKAREFATRFPEGTNPGEFMLSLTYWKCHGESVEFA